MNRNIFIPGNYESHPSPWLHHTFSNFLSDVEVNQLLQVYTNSISDIAGRSDLYLQKMHASDLINFFCNREILNQLTDISIRPKHRRLCFAARITRDDPEFKMPIHTDTEHKLATIIINLNSNQNGTELYDSTRTFSHAVAVEIGSGLWWENKPDTFHSVGLMHPTVLNRYNLIMNYWHLEPLTYLEVMKKCRKIYHTIN